MVGGSDAGRKRGENVGSGYKSSLDSLNLYWMEVMDVRSNPHLSSEPRGKLTAARYRTEIPAL